MTYPKSKAEIVEEVTGGRKDEKRREYNLSDAGNAELYADRYGERVRYDHRRGLFFVWNGERWAPDEDGVLTRWAVEAARRRGMAAIARGEANG